jgi:hypothetical protein
MRPVTGSPSAPLQKRSHERQGALAAREVKVASDLLVIRELLERAALREICLQASAEAGPDPG